MDTCMCNICTYTCIFTCVHVCIYVCTHVHTYTHAPCYTCIHACLHTSKHPYTCMHPRIHTSIHQGRSDIFCRSKSVVSGCLATPFSQAPMACAAASPGGVRQASISGFCSVHNTVRYTIRYGMVRYTTVRYGTVRYSLVQQYCIIIALHACMHVCMFVRLCVRMLV